MQVPVWAWLGFVALILTLIAVDLLAHSRKDEVTIRSAAVWSVVWAVLGLAFTLVIGAAYGRERAGEYVAGYLIERALAVDNLFVFALLMNYFAVPRRAQHKVLMYGVILALVFRAVFIGLGAALIEQFEWTLFIFGLFLVYTAVRLLLHDESEVDPGRNPLLRLIRRRVPMTQDYIGDKVIVVRDHKRLFTPLLAVLVVVGTTDVVFAVDSIPAIFAITTETFIVFTSNAFAVLGLLATYFLLAGMMNRFTYLNYGLAAVLAFVGVKMLLVDPPFTDWAMHLPIGLSLGVIAVCIGLSVGASLVRAPRDARPAD
ncbi:MAG: tellurite resistance protein TerC [Frankiaceae bacterium]|nr:tellurite resistance protein TerC [Frankiaceae bacterium]